MRSQASVWPAIRERKHTADQDAARDPSPRLGKLRRPCNDHSPIGRCRPWPSQRASAAPKEPYETLVYLRARLGDVAHTHQQWFQPDKRVLSQAPRTSGTIKSPVFIGPRGVLSVLSQCPEVAGRFSEVRDSEGFTACRMRTVKDSAPLPVAPRSTQALFVWRGYWRVGSQKRRKISLNQRRMAETKGFEPSRRFPACTLSRGVPSTTRPRLRGGV